MQVRQPDGVGLRPARAEDYPHFARLFAELGIDGPPPTFAAWESDVMRRSFFVEGPERPAAYATIDVLGRTGYVVNLVVEPERRREGVGRAVMGALAGHFHARGCDEWLLYVRPDNVPALRLYQSLGMRVGRRETTWRVSRGHVESLPLGPPLLEAVPATREDLTPLTLAFGLIPGKLNRFAESPAQALWRLVEAGRPGDMGGGWMLLRPRDGLVRSLFARTPVHARVLLEAAFQAVGAADALCVVTADEALEGRLEAAGARVLLRTRELRGRLPPDMKTPGPAGPGRG